MDRALKAAGLRGSDKAVADNLIGLKILDIPKVIVKKEVSCAAASTDQRGPSVQNFKGSLYGCGLKNLNGKKPVKVDLYSRIIKVESLKMDVDLLYTA